VVEHEGHGRARTLAAEIRRRTGLNAAKCYQCGKCSAGCPMAEETTLRPHDILRLVQRNRARDVFGNNSIWLCLTCETCTTRCPNEVDPARIIDALREMAYDDPENRGRPPRKIRAFNRAFLDWMRRAGRMYEFGMIAEYKLRSGSLFSDLDKAPAMMARGTLKLLPPRIKGIDDVRRIFEACEARRPKRSGDNEAKP